MTTAAPKTSITMAKSQKRKEGIKLEVEWWSNGVLGERKTRTHAFPILQLHYSITPAFGYFFSFHFKTTPCITPPISSSLSLLCTISARVSPVMA